MNYVSHFTVVCTYWFILNTYCILLLIGCPTKMLGKCRLHMLFGQRGVPCKREMSLNSWLLRYHIELIFCVERNDGTNMIEFMGFHFFNVWLLGCSIQEGAKGKLYRCNPEIKFGKDLASIPQQGFESCPLLEIFLVHALAIIYSMPPHIRYAISPHWEDYVI